MAPPSESNSTRKRRVSVGPSPLQLSGDEEDGGSTSSGAYRSPQAMPMGRSYVAHSGPAPSTWKASQSWTHDSDDIREGSARLGNLSLIDAVNARKQSFSSATRSLPPSPVGPPAKPTYGTSPLPPPPTRGTPSNLALMLNAHTSPSSPTEEEAQADDEGQLEVRTRRKPSVSGTQPQASRDSSADSSPGSDTLRGSREISPATKPQLEPEEPRFKVDVIPPTPTERTALLSTAHAPASKSYATSWSSRVSRYAKETTWMPAKRVVDEMTWSKAKEAGVAPFRYIPATILGVLMNVLDGVSYGLVTFPTLPVFAGFGGIGVSMFFVSCIVSQFVTTSRSVFRGGNGSMMIEVVPFLHQMAFSINASVGEDQPDRVIATTMVAIALSSVLTGLTFFLLGSLRLGVLLQYFPRHILVGCIGGVGAFLVITGLQVTSRTEETDAFGGPWEAVQAFFADDLLPLWTIPLGLAILLRLITSRYTHPLIFPAFFLCLPFLFYATTASLGLPLNTLRSTGWVFDLGGDSNEPWWRFWQLFDFGNTDMAALVETIPTQLALVFFAILHVPINVPALALSVGNDNVQTDPELVNHGISNVLAGFFGTVPNYLCYVNSVLFYRLGGDSRLASTMLAIATALVMMTGTALIRVLPVMVVGALIYILGLDLLKEAVYDTYGRVSTFEYATIWLIVLVMTVQDFVVGIGVGIIVACMSFVVSSAKQHAVRFIQSGTSARSTVRRHPQQGKFLLRVGSQTRVMGLEGQIFFGTTSGVEASIRGLLDSDMRYLVLDFTRVYGIDFSAAEAFLRLQRLCSSRYVVLVLCGCSPSSPVGKALRAVDLWPGSGRNGGAHGAPIDNDKVGGSTNDEYDAGVEVFATLNDALEHCENAQLRSLYARDLRPHKAVNSPPLHMANTTTPILGAPVRSQEDLQELAVSPRRSHLYEAAKKTVETASMPTSDLPQNVAQPLPLLIQALHPYAEDLITDPHQLFLAVLSRFERVILEEGHYLWRKGEESDSLYIIESGILKAFNWRIGRSDRFMIESMMPATVAGEMSFMTHNARYADMIAERSCVLWRLSRASFEQLETDDPRRARLLRTTFLRIASEQQDSLVGHLIHSL